MRLSRLSYFGSLEFATRVRYASDSMVLEVLHTGSNGGVKRR